MTLSYLHHHSVYRLRKAEKAERIFSWLDNFRRLARNYERHCRTVTNMVLTAEIYRLLWFL